MRDWIRSSTLLFGSAAAFAVSWHLGLWLIVVAMAATAIALPAYERLGEHALAQRAAAWALYAPHGGGASNGVERTLAADLTTTATGDTHVLDASISQAERTITNPWLRALATERIELAKRLAADYDLPPPPALLRGIATRGVCLAAVVSTTVLTLTAAATRHDLVLIPLTLSIIVLGIAYGEAQRRRTLPRVLCKEASKLPPPEQLITTESTVIGALESLTAGHKRVLTHAAAIAARAGRAQRDLALRRLARVDRMSFRQCEPTLTRATITWGTTAVLMVTAIEVAL
ncbi:MAG: hypothetical protein ACT452_03825 [Microthrixaceae bacterium]